LFASFADKNVGGAKPVSLVVADKTGLDAGNYVFGTALTGSATASITPALLTLSAATVFAQRGYAATTMNDIAEACADAMPPLQARAVVAGGTEGATEPALLADRPALERLAAGGEEEPPRPRYGCCYTDSAKGNPLRINSLRW